MSYKHETSRRHESVNFPGVIFYLRKMTEGRRLDLRTRIAEPNRRVMEILKEQAVIEGVAEGERDTAKWLQLQDEFDGLMLEKINPEWIKWGVKHIEGIESDGVPLTVDTWKDWPSLLFGEILDAVKQEAELLGSERKNLPSPTTSGAPEAGSLTRTTAPSAENEGSGELEIVVDTTRIV